MPQIILENLDPVVIEKLQARATRQGRSLAEELKAILEAVAEDEEVSPKNETLSQARERLAKVRKQYEGRSFQDSAALLREDRQR